MEKRNSRKKNLKPSQGKRIFLLFFGLIFSCFFCLSLFKSFSSALADTLDYAEPGDIIRYTINYKNIGEIDISTALINNPIPEGTTFKDNSLLINGLPSENASYDEAFNQVSFILTDISPSELGELSFKVEVNQKAPEIINNTAKVDYQPGSFTASSSIAVNFKPKSVCGNGVLEEGEVCDYGELNSNIKPNACRENCLLAYCSDRVIDTNEECDDGNLINNDGCDSACLLEKELEEEPEEELEEKIEEELKEEPKEELEEEPREGAEERPESKIGLEITPSEITTTEGLGGISRSICGNEVLEQGEECDDGNRVDKDGCSSACQIEGEGPICGNEVLEQGEQCDSSYLGKETCVDLGFEKGELKCREDCNFDTTNCVRLEEAPLSKIKEISLLVSKEIIEKVGQQITQATQQIAKIYKKQILENKEAQTVNKTITAPAITTVMVINTLSSIPLATTAIPFFQYVIFFLVTFFTEPTYLLTKKRKQWGTVYDSLSKQPLGLAAVRLYEAKTNKLVSTKVTGRDGRYYFLIDPDKEYHLSVKAAEYEFPSKYLEGVRMDNTYDDIYYGETIQNPKEQKSIAIIEYQNKLFLPRPFINFNIPLDFKSNDVILSGFNKKIKMNISNLSQYLTSSLEEKEEEYKKILKQAKERRIGRYLAYLGPIFTLICFIISPTFYVLSLLIVHFLLFYLFRLLARRPEPKPWGYVYEKDTKRGLPKAIIRLFDSKFGKLILTKVTFSDGRYGFSVGNDKYVLTCEKLGYILPEEKIQIQGKKDGIIRKEIVMEKVNLKFKI